MRVLSYNVRRCLGTDGVVSPARIADVIASCTPDVVALQELDVRRARSGGADQAQEIAGALDARHVFFHPALRVLEEEYGDAIITMLPSRLVRTGALPQAGRFLTSEPRGAIWAAVSNGGSELQVINTHLGLTRVERRAQATALLGPHWLGHPDCRGPAILVGDFNSLPGGRVHRALTARLRDAHGEASGKTRPANTFPSSFPLVRIDHVFAGTGVEVVSAEVVRTALSRVASDHLPLLVEIRLSGA
jgi:endonuclease/exonuclease/phosphatase family metal-dependent hydrolase